MSQARAWRGIERHSNSRTSVSTTWSSSRLRPLRAGPGASAGATPSMTDQLSQLATLHQQGALTDDEFAAAKAKLLGG